MPKSLDLVDRVDKKRRGLCSQNSPPSWTDYLVSFMPDDNPAPLPYSGFTTRMCSSRNCFGETSDGAPIIKSSAR